jgi:hypothetical protein
MAGNESIAAKAMQVYELVLAAHSRCHAAVIQSDYRGVDVRSFALDVGELLELASSRADEVATALRRARVVSFRVLE